MTTAKKVKPKVESFYDNTKQPKEQDVHDPTMPFGDARKDERLPLNTDGRENKPIKHVTEKVKK